MERLNSLRYSAFDYTASGVYLVTICVNAGRHVYGTVANSAVHLSDAGRMIQATLLSLLDVVPSLVVDSFVVMPDHVHVLMFIGVDTQEVETPITLGAIVGRFKTLTTSRYIDGVKQCGWQQFDGKLWQRNFYDHIMRSDRGVEQVRAYIEGKPCTVAGEDGW